MQIHMQIHMRIHMHMHMCYTVEAVNMSLVIVSYVVILFLLDGMIFFCLLFLTWHTDCIWWPCQLCTFENKPGHLQCDMCGTLKQETETAQLCQNERAVDHISHNEDSPPGGYTHRDSFYPGESTCNICSVCVYLYLLM